MDKVFEKLVNNTLKFNVFRVKKLALIEVPGRDWGKFYSGDCYLVFDNRYGATHIFYWIGSNSSQDEQAVVAIKAVELDNLFQGVPVQYREVEGHESQRFKKLFDGGIVTLKGGFDAGLQRIQKKEHVPKLFQVKHLYNAWEHECLINIKANAYFVAKLFDNFIEHFTKQFYEGICLKLGHLVINPS